MAKVVIWASGKARPIQSASTTGSPVRAATMKLCSEFAPPDLKRHHGDEGPAQPLG